MENAKKFITFIVPAYNIAKFVHATLDSILYQTDKDFKIILVNDGSTDEETPKICDNYAKKYPQYIKYISQENKGLGGARNTGLKHVETKYLMFLDSDDILDLFFIEYLKKNIGQNYLKEIDMIFTLPKIYDELNHNIYNWYDHDLFIEIFRNDNIQYPNLEKKIFDLEVNSCRKVYSSRFINDLKFTYKEKIKFEDFEPHFYLLMKSQCVAGFEITSFYYRVNRENQITQSTGKSRLDMIEVFRDSIDLIRACKRDDLYNTLLRKIIDFSRWSIDVSDIDIKIEFLKNLKELFMRINKKVFKNYYKNVAQSRRKISPA